MNLRYSCVFLLLLLPSIGLGAPGKFTLFLKGFKSAAYPLARDIYVYLPGEYARLKNKSYPVLYIHDGQNLFDPSRAFMGQTWMAEASLNKLIAQKLIAPVIVVAIDNTADRSHEYTPDFDPGVGVGGGADDYLNQIAYVLKPKIDRQFRTSDTKTSTGILGSSLGGLVSIVAGLDFPETFGLVGALSPSIWWNNSSLFSVVMGAANLPEKIYLDSGDSGGERPDDVQWLSEILKRRGLSEGKTIKTVIQQGAIHSERFWAQRFPVALQFLFPPN